MHVVPTLRPPRSRPHRRSRHSIPTCALALAAALALSSKYDEIERDEGGTAHQYTLFFPIDAADAVATTPLDGKDLCFRKPGGANLPDPKASDREMTRAKAALSETEE